MAWTSVHQLLSNSSTQFGDIQIAQIWEERYIDDRKLGEVWETSILSSPSSTSAADASVGVLVHLLVVSGVDIEDHDFLSSIRAA